MKVSRLSTAQRRRGRSGDIVTGSRAVLAGRRALACSVLAMAVLAAAPVLAETVVERIERELVQQGFTTIKSHRTWLGRVLIDATNATEKREIVVNPTSGEILRDFTRTLGGQGSADLPVSILPTPDGGSRPGPGGSGGPRGDHGPPPGSSAGTASPPMGGSPANAAPGNSPPGGGGMRAGGPSGGGAVGDGAGDGN